MLKTFFLILQDVLLRLGLSISEGKGLCYYGATTMMGAKNGVAKRFKYLNSKILVVHCFEHLLIYARFH